jgi:hypothetical protein
MLFTQKIEILNLIGLILPKFLEVLDEMAVNLVLVMPLANLKIRV